MVDALAVMGEFLTQTQKAKPPGDNQHKKQDRFQKRIEAPPSYKQNSIPPKQAMHAQALATVKETKPALYEKVRAGEVSVSAAHQEVKRQAKREELKERAEVTPIELKAT
jgi:hypothetical protein